MKREYAGYPESLNIFDEDEKDICYKTKHLSSHILVGEAPTGPGNNSRDKEKIRTRVWKGKYKKREDHVQRINDKPKRNKIQPVEVQRGQL